MPDLDMVEMPSVDDIQPLEAVPAGEYNLICVDTRFSIDVNDHFYMQPRFKILNELNAKTFTKYVPMPSNNMDEEELDRVQRQLHAFCVWLGLPTVGGKLTKEVLKGLKGRAILKQKGAEEDEFGIQNEIARYL